MNSNIMLLFRSTNHHAKLLVHPSREKITNLILNDYKNSPAIVVYNQNVIDIDTVRALSSWHIKEMNTKKTAILSFHTITHQAQNAILKLIEEPRDDTSFIFITTQKENILSTVLSRMVEVSPGLESQIDIQTDLVNEDVNKFLETPKVLRMKLLLVKKILDAEDKDGRKDRESVQIFCMKLEQELAKQGLSQNLREVKELRRMISFLGDSSGSPKMILEYLSLLLPVKI